MNQNDTSSLFKEQSRPSPENPLFRQARSGRLRLPEAWLSRWSVPIEKLLYPGIVVIFAYLVTILSSIVGFPLLIIPYFLPALQESAWGPFLILSGAFLPYFFLIGLWLWIFEQRSLWTTGMQRPILKRYVRGVVVGLIMFSAVIGFLAIFDAVITETPLAGRFNLGTLAGALLIFGGWMIQGAAEELLARGFLLPILGTRWGLLPGVILSSLFFALLHLANPHITVLSLLNLALFGFFAAIYVLHEGALWGIFAIHAVWNWAQGNLYGFSVSGLEIVNGIVLFDLIEDGPDWLTGGLFGPEGGLVVTIVLIISILLVWLVGRRAAKKVAPDG